MSIKYIQFDEQAKNKNKSLLLTTTQSQVFIHKYLFIYMKS
jgi:hypothetical protein